MAKYTEHINLTKFDDLVGGKEIPQQEEICIEDLHPFKGHPFQVKDNQEMELLVESIKTSGVLVPITVREDPSGGYEILAGHRRTHAAKLAGLTRIPAQIRAMDDDAATVYMVESNRQRESILPSEKAFAYRMLMEALRHQGKRKDGETTAEEIGKSHGDSKSNVKRYIRLTYLLPDILTKIDEKKLGMVQGVEISYLRPEEQEMLLALLDAGVTVKRKQAELLKQASQEGRLDISCMRSILTVKENKRKVTLKSDRISRYFPPEYSETEIEEVILGLLENWKQEQED